MTEDRAADALRRPAIPIAAGTHTMFAILMVLAVCHLLNDMTLSLVPATYPLLKESYHLDFGQIGFITLSTQLTASIMQPVIGSVTDRRPRPLLLPFGLSCGLIGLLLLAMAYSYPVILLAATMVGIGSAVFHPETSRMVRVASGGRHGFAQSLFQVGGTTGTAIGPLLAAFVVVPFGQAGIAWFAAAALLAILLLIKVSLWQARHPSIGSRQRLDSGATSRLTEVSRAKAIAAIGVLMALLLSKNVYTASLTSFYTFYLIRRFQISVTDAQVHLFIFLGALAAGTFFGGLIGDRVGRRPVIWFSILGALPFTVLLPYADLWWTGILSIVIGLIMASAFSAILVYAQELLPGRVGMVSGMFFGFAFGLGGLGAAALGRLADMTDIETVYRVCSFLPLIGVLTVFLPDTGTRVVTAQR